MLKRCVLAGEIWAGRPAKMLRKLEEEEMAFICRSADNYSVLAADHAIENAKTFPEVTCALLETRLLLSAQGPAPFLCS